MKPSEHILVVDDEPSMRRYLQTLLEVDGYRVATASSGEEALARLEGGPAPHLVLLDLLMPGIDGLETLERLRGMRPELKTVMLSCVNDSRKIAQAIRLGAQDYLTKPFQKADLDAVLSHCLHARAPGPQAGAGEDQIEELSDDVFFVCASPAMRRIRSQVSQMAQVDVPVLMLGESGTGKEVVARLIHKLSTRAHRPMLKVNCAALPGELLESELFGYEAGAFTGANRAKPGQFELCDRGTILLDEIGELPPGLQAKLLHVLQDQTFSRLGGRSLIQVDVRILAATNIDVQQALAAGKLRSDLFYRLNAFTLTLPPLRERREEIPLLLRHFMALYAGRYARAAMPVSPALVDACVRHSWPGNLRELENFVKRYLILGDESLVLNDLRSVSLRPGQAGAAAARRAAAGDTHDLKALVRGVKDEAEIEAITRTLERTKWNRKEASRILKISYKALLYKIRQYDIDRT
ncbi:MAG TPA: sigma-54 dependent transcriptional regulator [Terriglobia bacterium]|nr:sigma-54 dependent transcriptional regulator [Terriglobia bacterium]